MLGREVVKGSGSQSLLLFSFLPSSHKLQDLRVFYRALRCQNLANRGTEKLSEATREDEKGLCYSFFPPETKQSCQLTLPSLPQLQRAAGAASSRQETSGKGWEPWDSCSSAGSCAKPCLEGRTPTRAGRERLLCCEPWQPAGGLGTWLCSCLLGTGLGNRAGCRQKSAQLLAKVCLNDTAP